MFQLFNIKFLTGRQHVIQAGIRARLLATAGGYFKPGGTSQLLNCIKKFQSFILHQETDYRSMRTTSETMVKLLFRTDGKRRGLLIVKRATSLEFAAYTF